MPNTRFVAQHLPRVSQELMAELVDLHMSAAPGNRYFVFAVEEGPSALRFVGRGAARDRIAADRTSVADLVAFGLLDVVRPGQVDWYQVNHAGLALAEHLRSSR